MKTLFNLFSFCLIAAAVAAQPTSKMNYQAVARNSGGAILANQSVGLRLTIEQGSGGAVLYQERQTPTTNQFGLFTVQVGNGTLLSGNYNTINWSGGNQWLMVEMDPAGGTVYTSMGESQLLSVPYANVSALSNTPWATSGSNIYNTNTANVGIGTSNPTSQLEISGTQPNQKITWTQSANFGRILFNEAGTLFSTIQNVGSTYSNPNRQNALELQNLTATGPISLWTNGTERMRFTGDGNIGIGTIAPDRPVKIMSNFNVASQGILHVESTASGGLIQSYGIYSKNAPLDGYGIGGYFEGGGTGLSAKVNATSNNGYIGLDAYVSGGTAGSLKYGASGSASGPGSLSYGVYGWAVNATTNYSVYCDGSGGYTGTWTNVSDVKFKKDIVPVSSALGMVTQLNPVSYQLRKDEFPMMNFPSFRQYGFVAQELENVIPLLVENGAHPGATKEDKLIEFKSVNYIGMIPILTKAIQEQQQLIKNQQTQIDELKAEVGKLKK